MPKKSSLLDVIRQEHGNFHSPASKMKLSSVSQVTKHPVKLYYINYNLNMIYNLILYNIFYLSPRITIFILLRKNTQLGLYRSRGQKITDFALSRSGKTNHLRELHECIFVDICYFYICISLN